MSVAVKTLKVLAAVFAFFAAYSESARALYVDISAPVSGTAFVAPASISITADAFPGTYTIPIAKVEFYADRTLIGTDTTYPYGITWSNVAVGTYALTAEVTDTRGNTDISDEVLIAVTSRPPAQIYYIVADQLNTPRLIADSTGITVWRWDQGEPFGNDVPNTNPSGAGAFDFPLRFPGQYFDQETNLAYNLMRDYDSIVGRYVQGDPIGLRGGLNLYLYAGGKPIEYADPTGLVMPGAPPKQPPSWWPPNLPDPKKDPNCYSTCIDKSSEGIAKCRSCESKGEEGVCYEMWQIWKRECVFRCI